MGWSHHTDVHVRSISIGSTIWTGGGSSNNNNNSNIIGSTRVCAIWNHRMLSTIFFSKCNLYISCFIYHLSSFLLLIEGSTLTRHSVKGASNSQRFVVRAGGLRGRETPPMGVGSWMKDFIRWCVWYLYMIEYMFVVHINLWRWEGKRLRPIGDGYWVCNVRRPTGCT